MQIAVRECLLSCSAEYFVFQFAFSKSKAKIHRNIILPILYGCATWSLTLRVELRLMVFGNRVLRITFWRKRDEIRREWRKLHNDGHND